MKRQRLCIVLALAIGGLLVSPPGCAREKKRSITIEGPEKKIEVEIKSTEKNRDDD